MTPADTHPVLEEYSALAPHYDRRWASYIDTSVRETLRRFEVEPGQSVLDVGCGTGALLERLAATAPGARLSGVDLSPEMLEEARKKLGAAIPLKQSNVNNLPFASHEFDVVVSTNALHYFRNPAAALEEMARVLRPNGRLVITDWCHDFFISQLFEWKLRAFDRAHVGTLGQKRCRRLLDQAGFEVTQLDRYKIDWRWGLMTVISRKRDESVRKADGATQRSNDA
jgi:ubiquinone/menaquinone biosynthesis C-methylase UbiE